MTSEIEVLHLPTRWVLERYRSTEGATWEATRVHFAANHTHLDALTEDIRAHGVRTPVQLDPAGLVRRGHHRLLIADAVGTPVVPVVFAWLDEATIWSPATRTDVPDEDVEWDDEPWTDRLYPVPDSARAVALDHSPA